MCGTRVDRSDRTGGRGSGWGWEGVNEKVIHSLGIFISVAAGGAGLVIALGWAVRVRGIRSVRRRAASLLRGSGSAGPGSRLRRWSGRTMVVRTGLPAVGAGCTGLLLVGGIAGCVVGLGAACGVWRWQRRDKRTRGEPVAKGVEAQLPFAADLLAACMAAGAGPREAAAAVGASLGGPVGERLAQAAAEVRLGGEPGTAWGRLGSLPGARGLARCLERAQATGVPAVEPMSRLAGQLRATRGRTAGIRARRAGVLATAPLGLCFLPAFLTVGVVPVVIGLASGLMDGN
ncbi:type II secretion system F family protein [Streptomyces syringium]|uniref:type II secretion system F family protein n=1 Tax=Streptomyces syringium TaxID=76729 RepID=UPI0037D3021B